jgi:GTP diphosphokinase / guanosine-3',5'-bis(diphosphate) 3'-diphosphatase
MESGLIIKAREFATKKHDGQVRRDGTPYINHAFRVMSIVFEFKERNRLDELFAAALLHDTLEDTNTGISELRENFGEVIALLVVELTTDKLRSKVVGKTEYLSGKFSNERAISSWALVIKLADRLDNVSDLDTSDRNFAVKKKAETLGILNVLEKKRELTNTHKKLILAIREKLNEFD